MTTEAASPQMVDDGEPLDRTPATIHRTDITIRNAITALNWPRPNARGALALGHGGWRTCATCVPRDEPGLNPWTPHAHTCPSSLLAGIAPPPRATRGSGSGRLMIVNLPVAGQMKSVSMAQSKIK